MPHYKLFVEGLTPDVTEDKLVELFSSYSGYKEVRMVQSKRVAFIEFEDEQKAGNAMSALIGAKIGDYTMQVSYAKR